MKKSYHLVLIYFFFNTLSCKNGVPETKYDSTNTFKKEILTDNKTRKNTVSYSFYENGEIKEIHKYDSNGKQSGEQLWFDSSGNLEKKISLINDKAEGNGYFFYPHTGTMAGQRFYRNDKMVFHGITYWEDSLPMIHSILYINDSGDIYYEKNFDINGNFIGEIGKKK